MPASRDNNDAFASARDSIWQAAEQGKPDPQRVVDILHGEFDHYSWVGIYVVSADELVLGPWRGPEATEHVRIPIGQGICGAAAASGRTEIVDDVTADARYLACFPSTQSEIVVPIARDGVVIGEIDIDSDRPHAFDDADRAFLEEVAALLAPALRTGQTVADVMLASPKTLPADASVATARELFENRRVEMALLVENDRLFRGALTRDDLPDDASLDSPALPFARPGTPIRADTSADAAFEQITRHPDRRLVVLAEDGETLVGLLCLDARKTRFCGGAEAYVPSDATA